MAPRPPIQAVIEQQAELDTKRRNWRMVLFNEDGTPFSGGGATEIVADVALSPGWQNFYEFPYEPLRRIKQGRLVTVVGVVQVSGVQGDGSVIGTLPEGWRPENALITGMWGYFDINPGYGHVRVDIEPDGDIVNRGSLGPTNWIALSVSFLVP